MVAKPSTNTILKTYSLSELLDLVKEKAQMDTESRLRATQEQIAEFSKIVGDSLSESYKSATVGKRGPAKRGRRKGKKMSLGDYVQEALTSEPAKVDDIMESIKALGYKSKSKDPRRILYLELKKQVEKGNVKKTGRGMYALK